MIKRMITKSSLLPNLVGSAFLAGLFVMSACGEPAPTPDSNDKDETGSSTGKDSSGSEAETTDGETGSDATDGKGTGDKGEEGDGSTTGEPGDKETTGEGDGTGDDTKEETDKPDDDTKEDKAKKLGESCEKDEECGSEVCRELSKGNSVCSECSEDKDCKDASKGIACVLNSVDKTPQYFACSDGALGQLCEDNDHCADKAVCAEGFGPAGSDWGACSECKEDKDCGDDSTCFAPIGRVPRYNSCVDDGSLAAGQLCPRSEDGDDMCAGYCGELPEGGKSYSVELGVCGACTQDAHCGKEERCKPAKYDGVMLLGATCVAKDEEKEKEKDDEKKDDKEKEKDDEKKDDKEKEKDDE